MKKPSRPPDQLPLFSEPAPKPADASRVGKRLSRYPDPIAQMKQSTLPEGARLAVMMADETIVVLRANREVRANSSVQNPDTKSNPGGEYEISTIATVAFVLNESNANALIAQNATHIRVEATDKNYDVEIHKKSLGDIRQAIKCIR